jgi:hypothetical protein
LKPWSLFVGLNGFTHELINPQANNILLVTWGQTMNQKNVQISHYWPQDFLVPIHGLKRA